MTEPITELSAAVAAVGALPMPVGNQPQPMSDEQLAEIDNRAAHLYEDVRLPAEADIVVGEDVPALLAEVERLKAELDGERENYAAYRTGAEGAKGMLARRIDAVTDLCDGAEQQARRWENPLPVPEWVERVRAAATGEQPAPRPRMSLEEHAARETDPARRTAWRMLGKLPSRERKDGAS